VSGKITLRSKKINDWPQQHTSSSSSSSSSSAIHIGRRCRRFVVVVIQNDSTHIGQEKFDHLSFYQIINNKPKMLFLWVVTLLHFLYAVELFEA
jgi:hypothetical protein